MNRTSSIFHDLFPVMHQAGENMLHFSNPAVYQKSGHANFVSQADLANQQLLQSSLLRLFPQARFLGEQGEGDQTISDALTFVVDPIDGTTNYLRHRRCSVISVALFENRMPILGAIFNPYTNEMFYAQQGHGAFCNSDRIHVSETPMENALIALGTSPYLTEMSNRTGECVKKLLQTCADIRRSGSAAYDLCDVASGCCDGMFEWALQPWDYGAGTIIIRESGGKCGSISGGDIGLHVNSPFMAANARIFDRLQLLLQESAE